MEFEPDAVIRIDGRASQPFGITANDSLMGGHQPLHIPNESGGGPLEFTQERQCTPVEIVQSLDHQFVVNRVAVIVEHLGSINHDGLPCRADSQKLGVHLQETHVTGLDGWPGTRSIEFTLEQTLTLGPPFSGQRPSREPTVMVDHGPRLGLNRQQLEDLRFRRSKQARQLRDL